MKRDDEGGIDERSFRFHRDVLKFLDGIPIRPNTKNLIEQLADSAGSIGGNREEALGGTTRKQFINFNEIALRGANESVRWLRVCLSRRLGDREECIRLLDEARQEARIIAKIVITSKRHSRADNERADPPPDPNPGPST